MTLREMINESKKAPAYAEVYDIEWDVDDEEDLEDLPTKVKVKLPTSIFNDEDETDYEDIVSEYVSDYLSDEYGFTHNGFKLKIK